MSTSSAHWLHSTLMRVRPAQLASALKLALRIRRTVMVSDAGFRFWTDPVSVFGMHLARSGTYEPQMTRLLRALLRPSDVFLDIGGNEGYFSVVAASLVKAGNVHCIEPQSRLHEILQRNFALNGSAVALHQCALSNRDGHVELYLRPSTNTGASSVYRHWSLGFTAERVPAERLDSFFDRHSIATARLIKIDCEGAEGLVIDGASQVLADHRAEFIAMEYHTAISGPDICHETHRRITSAGYVLTRVAGQCVYHLPSHESSLRSLGELTVNASFE